MATSGLRSRRRKLAHVHGSLAGTAGALAIVIQGALEVLSFYIFTFLSR